MRLTAPAQQTLEQPELRIEVRGYTDSVGTDACHMKLSQRRADAVKAYLVAKGIDGSTLSARGFGNAARTDDTTRMGAGAAAGNGIFLCLMLICLAGCTALRPPASPSARTPPAITDVVLARRGWHIDVGVSTADLGSPLAAVAALFPGARYLMFGFGDRHYLMSRHHAGLGPLAALWPGPGLLLVTGLISTPAEAFGTDNVRAVDLDPRQWQALQAFLWDSLADRGRSAVPEAVGPYGGSLYFGARPRYSAVHTCNTWAAEALRASGLRIHSVGTVFAGQLWEQISRVPATGRP